MLKRISVMCLLVLCICVNVCNAEKEPYWEEIGEYNEYEIYVDRNALSKNARLIYVNRYDMTMYYYSTTIFTWNNKTKQKIKYKFDLSVGVKNSSETVVGVNLKPKGKWYSKGIDEWEKAPYNKAEYKAAIPSIEYEIGKGTVKYYISNGSSRLE